MREQSGNAARTVTVEKSHIPAPGKASGLRGEALCGRYATYATGDHDMIRRQAREGGSHWCARCLARMTRFPAL